MAEDPRGLLSHFDALVGTEWLDDDPDHARVRVPVRDELRQPVGLMHGGVLSTLVESVCSRSTALAVLGDGMTAMGQSIAVSFIRPVTEGHAEVEASARHRRVPPLRPRPDDHRRPPNPPGTCRPLGVTGGI